MTRVAAEVATALVTLALGGAIAIGALANGIRWTDAGPEPGAFPFYVGVLVVGASLGNLAWAWRRHRADGAFLTPAQAKRIAAFGVPLLGFVALSLALGFYVATACYLCAVMRWQGRYRWTSSIAVALGTALFFFVVLEVWFKVPLLKGPLEAALRIH
jgi:putative tricarboxylic transport membrane protein